MKIIKLPPPMKHEASMLPAAQVLREVVLPSAYWRTGSDLKKIECNLAIEQALDNDPEVLRISDDACARLSEAMALVPAIPLVAANRFFMQIFRAVVRAEDAPEDSGQSA